MHRIFKNLSKKIQIMKNLLLILSIFSLAFVSCNEGGESTEPTTPEVTDNTTTPGDVNPEGIPSANVT